MLLQEGVSDLSRNRTVVVLTVVVTGFCYYRPSRGIVSHGLMLADISTKVFATYTRLRLLTANGTRSRTFLPFISDKSVLFIWSPAIQDSDTEVEAVIHRRTCQFC